MSRRRWLKIAASAFLVMRVGHLPPLVQGARLEALGIRQREPVDVRADCWRPTARSATIRRGYLMFDDFGEFNTAYWQKGNHRLGRGVLDPTNVGVDDGCVTLRLPANTYDGAEIASNDQYGYGAFAVQMKCANAPGSISTFFLYQGEASANDEVDIEIFEDRQYMMDLTTWVGGEATNHDRRVLAFDPTAEFHEYAISYHHKWISFYIDGRLHLTWTARLPTGRMKIVSNAWWPTWLSGPKPTADIHARVDSIRHLASRA